MLVWQRLGLLAFLVPAILYNVFNYLADALHGAGYSKAHHGPAIASLLISAVFVAGFGLWVSSYSKTIVEPKNGWERICCGKHTLLFVPMQYVAVLLVLIAAYMTLNPPATVAN
jgi:hypothetical protein